MTWQIVTQLKILAVGILSWPAEQVLAGHSKNTDEASWAVPRTPWDDPDLQGL